MADKLVKRTSSLPALKIGTKAIQVGRGESAKVTRREVDLCFVFDTTGSMSDKIDGLVKCMDSLVEQLSGLALDWRVTTVPFGDLTVHGDRVVEDQPFVTDARTASSQLRTMPRFSGGGNLGESSAEAMLAGCRKGFRSEAVKVLVLVTDEPALGSEQVYSAVDAALGEIDAACFAVAPDLPYYKRWAESHGGDWRQVGVAVDTGSILRLFESLLSRVVDLTDSVHRLGAGSVRAYLERGRS